MNIPYVFNSIVSSPLTSINEENPNIGRAKVAVFTKYGNRNGSYITEAVAKQLIDSTSSGMIPVVGFFDKQSGDWSTHLGAELASAYGYVEGFDGWEPRVDSDGVEREYAIFSVVLFSDYFDEAKNILGKSQSMELDINSINGEWAPIDGNEYFIYSTAKMRGFCVLGDDIEPCFSSSAFFSKEDENKTDFEKFSKLLFELREKVEGGIPMEEQNINVTEESAVVEEVINTEEVINNFENVTEEEVVVEMTEDTVIEEVASEFETTPEVEVEEVVENNVEEFAEVVEEVEEDNSELNNLRAEFEALQNSYNELQTQYNECVENNNNLTTQLNNANAIIAEYAAQAIAAENTRKNELVESFNEMLTEDEIAPIREQINDFNYEELESKLAVTFARKNMSATKNTLRAPVVEEEESSFAKLMRNYKK